MSSNDCIIAGLRYTLLRLLRLSCSAPALLFANTFPYLWLVKTNAPSGLYGFATPRDTAGENVNSPRIYCLMNEERTGF